MTLIYCGHLPIRADVPVMDHAKKHVHSDLGIVPYCFCQFSLARQAAQSCEQHFIILGQTSFTTHLYFLFLLINSSLVI